MYSLKSSDINGYTSTGFIQFVSASIYHQKTGDMDYETPTGMAFFVEQ